jgi:hypothetical protein
LNETKMGKSGGCAAAIEAQRKGPRTFQFAGLFRGQIPAITYFRAKGTIIGPGGLTAVFGKGTGVTLLVRSPENRVRALFTHARAEFGGGRVVDFGHGSEISDLRSENSEFKAALERRAKNHCGQAFGC